MTSPATETDLIPILDLAGLTSGDSAEIERLADQLRRALTEIGFFFVVNHGIDWSSVEAVYEQARRLHAMDPALLQNALMDADHGGYLGFAGGTSYASEIAGEVRKPNQNAAFFTHRGGYRMGNRWPDLDGFQPIVNTYMDQVQQLGLDLLPVYARALDLDPDWFTPHFDDPSCTQRLSHYPVMEYDQNEWGLAPHTDSSFMTLLPSNDVPGLEIRPAGHDWIEPPALPESFLINSGDMLKRWTNNRFLSTAHRVRNVTDRDRYAMPFFFGARDDAVIEAVPTCVDAGNPARHDPITYGDYQRWFINRNYAGVTGKEASAEAP